MPNIDPDVIRDLLAEPSSVTDMVALAIRARQHAERLAPDPAAEKLLGFAEALEARAQDMIDAANLDTAAVPCRPAPR